MGFSFQSGLVIWRSQSLVSLRRKVQTWFQGLHIIAVVVSFLRTPVPFSLPISVHSIPLCTPDTGDSVRGNVLARSIVLGCHLPSPVVGILNGVRYDDAPRKVLWAEGVVV